MTTIPWDIHQIYPSPNFISRKESGRLNHHHPPPRNTTSNKNTNLERIEYSYPERPGRRVQFSLMVKTDHASSHYITPEEEQAVWYNSKELRDLSYQDRDLILTAKQLGHLENGEFCLRGLETYLSRRAALEQRSRRVSIVKVVLFEQQSDHAAQMIRKKSLAISKEARQLALVYGQQDAEAVRTNDSSDDYYSENTARSNRRRRDQSIVVIDHKTRTICL